MHRTVLPIKNMHCKSCELLIEKAVRRVPGVKSARANFRKSEVDIHSHGRLDVTAVSRAIEETGYGVGEDDKQRWITRDIHEYGYIALGLVLLLVLYVLVQGSGLLRFSSGISGGKDLFSAVLIGLTAGISTCMALVGGLVLGMSARHAEKHPEATGTQKFRPHLFFNLGRIAGFFLLGGLLGAAGGFLSPSAFVLGLLTMAIAVVMLVLGLQLTEMFPRLQRWTLTLPGGLSRLLGISGRETKEYSHRGALTLGALTFFLPCGFTQLMQMNAIASGGFVAGGLMMAAFAAGTAPGLLGIGGLTSVVRGTGAKNLFKTAGLLVIAFALFNLQNGYNLTGWAPFWEGAQPRMSSLGGTTSQQGVQVVAMTQSANGFSPNRFVVKKGIPVRWVITGTDPNSCSAGISMPAFSILRFLRQGQNVIEFTPMQTGEIRFTCPMGMFPGSFTVVD